jgi:hypothetical protein
MSPSENALINFIFFNPNNRTVPTPPPQEVDDANGLFCGYNIEDNL